MNQAEFAAFVKIGKPKLGSYEAAIRGIPDDGIWPLARKIEKLTGFPAKWLVTGNLTSEDGEDPTERPRGDSNSRHTAYNSAALLEVRPLIAA